MLSLASPNEELQVCCKLGKFDEAFLYEIQFRGLAVLLPSRLALEFGDGRTLPAQVKLVDAAYASTRTEWAPIIGERSVIRDHYNEMSVTLQERDDHGRRLVIRFRAYDEGVAFRYELQETDKPNDFLIRRELTEFRFPSGCFAYEEHDTEGEYFRIPIGSIKDDCERPLTVEYGSGIVACITEAGTYDYSQMLFANKGGASDILLCSLSGAVTGRTPFVTPWRVVMAARRPGDLLENNDIILNLNPECRIADTSWIKPGKVIRVISLSTQGGKDCVDFAVRHGLQYIEYDAGWYGREYDDEADATFVSLDPERVAHNPDHDGLDLHEVIAYASRHDIGVILYVNRRALEKQLDELLPLYRSWGVKGIKFGFVQVGPQVRTRWLLDAVKKCAEHGLLVDIHDNYRPTGFSRTYPNLLTQEGIRGNEHFPTARHNATLPFTRFPAGAGDYTICYYDERLRNRHTHQLAMSVIVYSPLQFLFWYDKPSAYQGEPEVEFFKYLPVTWDELRVIHGVIGEYITIARRKGTEWYVATITNEEMRGLQIPLSFLNAGETYAATLYYDLPASTSRTNVGVGERIVDASTVISTYLEPCGGHVMRIVSAKK